jgi:glutathione S-transferase
LYESTAILDYLESTHPDPPLVPSNPRGRALVSMHMKLCDLQLCRPGGMIIFPKRFLPKERWDETLFAQARKEVEMNLAILEKQLEGKQYLVEDRYSLVEVCYAPFVDFFPLMEITPPPAVAAWAARMSERPSAVRTRPAR